MADLQHLLADLHQTASRLVILVGGEPLLRPDFARLAASIRSAGCSLGLVTTGRPLLYPSMRERLRRLSLAYLRVQLFGYGANHDKVTAPNLVPCANCGEPSVSHRACPSCGHYKGREVVATAAAKTE